MAFVVYSDKLQRAVDTALSPNGWSDLTPTHRSGRSTLTQQVAAPVAAAQGGDFTAVVEVKRDSEGKIYLPWTLNIHNPINPTKNQLVQVNNHRFEIPPFSKTYTDTTRVTIGLKYTPEGTDTVADGEAASDAKVEYTELTTNPPVKDTADVAYYYIADIRLSENTVKIDQIHQPGAVRFFHILTCPENEKL